MLLALVLPSVILALSIFYALMAVCLFVPLVAGLWTRLPGVPEAMAACGVGVVTLVSIERAGLSDVSPLLNSSLLGILASAATFTVVAAWRASRSVPPPRTR